MFNSETQTNNFETIQMKVAALLRDEHNVTGPTINVHHKVVKKPCQHSAVFGVKLVLSKTTEKHYKNPDNHLSLLFG